MANVKGMTKQSVIRCIVTSLHRIYGSTTQRLSDLTWRSRSPLSARGAFTLIELIVVVTVIVILTGLVLSTVGYVQKKAARSRTETEIAAMSAGLESYKADNSVYPPYSGAGGAHALYQGLSGDGNDAIGGTTPSTGTPGSSGKSYMTLKPNMLSPNPPNSTTRIIDPFDNDYNYLAPGTNNTSTFDLWSIANANPPSDQSQWIKNW
jgi:prepilin-type N-terminal cleavage/methylation domain-containing protein